MSRPELLSDMLARLQKLEQAGPTERKPQEKAEARNPDFEEVIPLVFEGVSGSTDWADSGSDKYIPVHARYALVFASVEDTNNGVGVTRLEARGRGCIWPIAAIHEQNTGTEDSSFSQAWVPVSEGRFDWKVTLASGASGGTVRIELLGYR